MLAQRHRLQLRPQADAFFSSATRIPTPLFSLWYRPADSFAAAVVVGKKVSKHAVERNRIKRAVLRVLQTCVLEDTAPSAEIVFTMQAAAAGLSREALEAAVRDALRSV